MEASTSPSQGALFTLRPRVPLGLWVRELGLMKTAPIPAAPETSSSSPAPAGAAEQVFSLQNGWPSLRPSQVTRACYCTAEANLGGNHCVPAPSRRWWAVVWR